MEKPQTSDYACWYMYFNESSFYEKYEYHLQDCIIHVHVLVCDPNTQKKQGLTWNKLNVDIRNYEGIGQLKTMHGSILKISASHIDKMFLLFFLSVRRAPLLSKTCFILAASGEASPLVTRHSLGLSWTTSACKAT